MADLAWLLLRNGYDAVARDREARGGGADYESRLTGRHAVVVRSRAGARTFYDEAVVRRRDAVPPPLGWLLFGRGAVHGLDGAQHQERKELFLDWLTPDRLGPLTEAVEVALRAQVATWPGRRVRVHDELVRAFGRGVLAWAGVPVAGSEADARSRQLAAVVDGFGFAGAAYVRGWRARLAGDRWARDLVEGVRSGRVPRSEGSVLTAIADTGLDPRTAAVELLNVLRPTVAVAWLGAFGALRFAEWPQWRARLADPGDARSRLAFAQEVRRTTPFVPVLAARVHHRAEVAGFVLQPKDFLVLDVLGIDHDPERWPDPELFDPHRMLDAQPGPFDLVPQGGGDPRTGHRCPGEDVTLRLLDTTLRVLALVAYEVGPAPVDRTRMPTLPADGLVVRVPDPVTRGS
jgi:fatty-acid peroxygenase